MKLSKEQIQQIDRYIAACGIEWIEVRAELVDHFANSLEEKLAINPTLDFMQAIVAEHKSFSDNGFKKLLETKKTAVYKQFYHQVFINLKSFFKLPKIIISIAVFYGLVLIMDLVNNKELFFMILAITLFLLVVQALVRTAIEKKSKNNNFLMLNRTESIFQLYNFLMLIFLNATTLRTENSFQNANYNYLQLGIFVLLILFYWCMEYVYLENKKYVQQNYPQIAN